MPRRCSCTASSFMGSQTLIPPAEVKLVMFTKILNYQGFWEKKGLKNNHIRVLFELYSSFFFFLPWHLHVQTHRGCVFKKKKSYTLLNSQFAAEYWELFPLEVPGWKLLFSLISLNQQEVVIASPRKSRSLTTTAYHASALSKISSEVMPSRHLEKKKTLIVGCCLCVFSVSTIHQGLPRNASSVLLWSLVSLLNMWLMVNWTLTSTHGVEIHLILIMIEFK